MTELPAADLLSMASMNNAFIGQPWVTDMNTATTVGWWVTPGGLANEPGSGSALFQVFQNPAGDVGQIYWAVNGQLSVRFLQGSWSAWSNFTPNAIIDSIADADTTHAPSRNAVFDALALKANLTGPQTVANTRINPRVVVVADATTHTINLDTTDQYVITAQSTAFTLTTTGTPVDGQVLKVRMKDNGTARVPTYNAIFISSGVASLIPTTIATKTHLMLFVYDTAAARFACMASDSSGY